MTSVWGAPAVKDEGGEEAAAPSPAAFPTLGGKESAFPTLGAAAAVKTTKKKAKQTMSLADFNAGASSTPARAAGGGGGSAYRAPVGRMGDDDNIQLPTGPRVRDDEEGGPPGIGGAFRDYGGDRGGAAEGGRYGARQPGGGRPKQASGLPGGRAAVRADCCAF